MQNYDYIITGSGASGLMLAYRMAKDSFFDNASILIIDKEKKHPMIEHGVFGKMARENGMSFCISLGIKYYLKVIYIKTLFLFNHMHTRC